MDRVCRLFCRKDIAVENDIEPMVEQSVPLGEAETMEKTMVLKYFIASVFLVVYIVYGRVDLQHVHPYGHIYVLIQHGNISFDYQYIGVVRYSR